jgi:hypothetical protein
MQIYTRHIRQARIPSKLLYSCVKWIFTCIQLTNDSLLCTWVHTDIHALEAYLQFMKTPAYAFYCVSIYGCMCMNLCMCLYIWMYVYEFKYVSLYMDVCKCCVPGRLPAYAFYFLLHACMQTYTHAYIHTCIYANIPENKEEYHLRRHHKYIHVCPVDT